jgi:hypothetical protein
MKRGFTDSVCHTKPETTYDNFARDFGERFVPMADLLAFL